MYTKNVHKRIYRRDKKIFRRNQYNIKRKKLTDKELINLVELRKTYFNFYDNSLSEYGVYDKDDLEKAYKERYEGIIEKNKLNR